MYHFVLRLITKMVRGNTPSRACNYFRNSRTTFLRL
eukprot:UN20590